MVRPSTSTFPNGFKERLPRQFVCNKQTKPAVLTHAEQKAGPDLALEGVDDELQGLRLHTLDALLHHVVPVLVLHTLEHVAIQLTHDVTLKRHAAWTNHRHQWTRISVHLDFYM